MSAFKVPSCVCLLSFFIIKTGAFSAYSPLQSVYYKDWVEKYLKYPPLTSKTSSSYVIITDTIINACESKMSCEILLNEVLTYERNILNLTKLSNFYISGSGDIFSGYEWSSGRTNPIYCGGTPYIEITFIGNAADLNFKPAQIRAAQRILEFGVIHGTLSDSYLLFGAWQLEGRNSLWTRANQDLISMWPHWSPEVEEQCRFIF